MKSVAARPRHSPGRAGHGRSRRAYLIAALLGLAATPAAQPADTAAGGSRSSGKRIARIALKYKGTRYKSGGNTPRGFDCSGFTQYVIDKTLKIDIGQSVPPQWRFGKRVGKGKWRAGDLVFFENTFERGLSHVGIYLGNNRFIHAENEDTGVVISRIDSDYYADHYYGARRLT